MTISNLNPDVSARKPAPKWARILRHLVENASLNRLEAEKYPLSDHVLPSTIAELNKRPGIAIQSKLIRIGGFANEGAYVAEYSLDPASKETALKLLTAVR